MTGPLATICRRADRYHIRISANCFVWHFLPRFSEKVAIFVLVKLSAHAGMLFFTRVGVYVTALQSMKWPNFRAIITLLSNNDPSGEQIVASRTVIDMDSGFYNLHTTITLRVSLCKPHTRWGLVRHTKWLQLFCLTFQDMYPASKGLLHLQLHHILNSSWWCKKYHPFSNLICQWCDRLLSWSTARGYNFVKERWLHNPS